jgi:hypothetical protein
MPAPLADEVLAKIRELKLELVSNDHPLQEALFSRLAPLRNSLLALEASNGGNRPLSASTFWEITPKYRFDILSLEIPKIANQLALAISQAAIYFPLRTIPIIPYSPIITDSFFWYHIDFGTRLVSSGWDRVALLLDLAFHLKTERDCSLRRVLHDIPRISSEAACQKSFRNLKMFRDTAFREIEGGSSLGGRHEVTHIMTPYTRLMFEFFDAAVDQPGKILPPERAEERFELLRKHHILLLDGVASAIDLVAWKWPELTP